MIASSCERDSCHQDIDTFRFATTKLIHTKRFIRRSIHRKHKKVRLNLGVLFMRPNFSGMNELVHQFDAHRFRVDVGDALDNAVRLERITFERIAVGASGQKLFPLHIPFCPPRVGSEYHGVKS